jgi:hypothetical protein
LVEHLTLNQQVAGSSPAGCTNKRNRFTNAEFKFPSLKKLDQRMRDENWYNVVKHVDGNELTGVYIKYKDDEINQA